MTELFHQPGHYPASLVRSLYNTLLLRYYLLETSSLYVYITGSILKEIDIKHLVCKFNICLSIPYMHTDRYPVLFPRTQLIIHRSVLPTASTIPRKALKRNATRKHKRTLQAQNHSTLLNPAHFHPLNPAHGS